MSEQDYVRQLAKSMVCNITFFLDSEMDNDVRESLERCRVRFRSIYRRPWRFKLAVVCQSSSETLAWLANHFGGQSNV